MGEGGGGEVEFCLAGFRIIIVLCKFGGLGLNGLMAGRGALGFGRVGFVFDHGVFVALVGFARGELGCLYIGRRILRLLAAWKIVLS